MWTYKAVTMSASLAYATGAPVADDVRSSLREFITRSTAGHQWWAESILFYDDPELPGHVVGATKLFVLLDDPAIDSFMAHADMAKIIDVLELSSERFGVEWELSIAGTPVGRIARGQRDEALAQAMTELLEICDVMDVDPTTLDRESILREYRDR
jgi:hypothetical protein